jgi:hypothetical protein
MEHTADVHLVERIEKGMVDGLTVARILQGPADLWTTSFDFEVRILTRSDPLIDLNETVFKALFKVGSMLLNRLFEQWQAGVGNQCCLVLPALIVQKIVFKTAEADAIATEDIACFQAIPEEPIDQKLITVWEEMPVPMLVLCVEIAFSGVGYEAERECRRRIVAEWSSLPKDVLQKVHGFDQRGVP